MVVPSPSPGREGHADQDRDEEDDGHHEQHGGRVRGDCGGPALQARHLALLVCGRTIPSEWPACFSSEGRTVMPEYR
jgi:hypothetical protein